MRRLIGSLLTAALSTGVLTTSARAARPDAQKAASLFADIKPNAPGCAAIAARDGRTIWSGGFGRADIAANRPITPDTVFNLASLSKQFTAFSILQLEAAGKLKLDQSIRDVVPELGAYAQPVTLRHLLHHSGGLQDYMILATLSGIKVEQRMTQAETVALLARQTAPEFAPGSEYSYSNTGYFLLSLVVERVSGQSMKDYAKAHIFTPLGMRNSSIVDSYPTSIPTLARGYAKDEAGTYKISESLWEQTGDGQVHSSVRDLMLWTDNLRTGRLGGKVLAAHMRDVGLLNTGEPSGYAMGLGVGDYRGTRQVGHSGEWASYNGYMTWLPEAHFAGAVLCNTLGLAPWERTHDMADIFAAAHLAPVKPRPPVWVRDHARLPVDTIAPGNYSDAQGNLIRLERRDGGLWIDYYGTAAPLTALSATILTADLKDDRAYIATPQPGRIVTGFSQNSYTVLKPWPGSSLDSLTGDYGVDTLDAKLTIKRGKDGLVITMGPETLAMTPVGEDSFTVGDYGVIRFAPDGRSFTAGFARGLIFKRR